MEHEIVGLQEMADLLEVGRRTPQAWQYRRVLPPADFPSVNGCRAWRRETIVRWAAETGRLPERLAGESPIPVAARRGSGRATGER